MAGKNRYDLAVVAFKEFIGDELGAESIRAIIRTRLSADENKVISYFRMLSQNGFLQEYLRDDGVARWKVVGDDMENNKKIIKAEKNSTLI